MYKKEFNLDTNHGITRRGAIRVLGFGALAYAIQRLIPNNVDPLVDILNTHSKEIYFKAMKIGNGTYLGYRGRVFEVVDLQPSPSRGINHLVSIVNPSYNRAELRAIGELAKQLYKNPILEKLEEGKIEKIPFDKKKVIGYLQPYIHYPIPKQINNVKNLVELVQK